MSLTPSQAHFYCSVSKYMWSWGEIQLEQNVKVRVKKVLEIKRFLLTLLFEIKAHSINGISKYYLGLETDKL